MLHGNGIYAIMRDQWGNVVIGSYSGGIDRARPEHYLLFFSLDEKTVAR